VDTNPETPPNVGGYLQTLAYFIFSSAIIFYFDIITPLGLTVWILYFIPLFLTLRIRWKFAPFAASGFFIILIGASFFISPRDVSVVYALANRIFFSLILIISSFFLWRYKANLEELVRSEDRYRTLTEWSPDSIIVYREGEILYFNPATLSLFGADNADELIGKDIIDLTVLKDKDRLKQRISQTMMGAPLLGCDLTLSRFDQAHVRVKVSGARVIWNGNPAIQFILKDITE